MKTPLSHPKTAFIMAAGTGGHIMPGLAIAADLNASGWAVHWLGTQHGMEQTLVPAAGITLHGLAFAGLRGKGALGMARGVWQLMGAFFAARTALKHSGAAVVVGMGGYVCVPGAWAARSLGIPLVLVNADADLLLSNKTLAQQAHTVCCGFAGSAAQLPNAVVTGNPVRADVAAITPPTTRFAGRSGPLRLLVVGGSLGAQVLNQTVPAALALVQAAANRAVVNGAFIRVPSFEVLHQTGAKSLERTQAAYSQSGVDAQIVPFIDDMASAYATADIVVCRAGAITVSELCAAGVPAVLVPFLANTTRHQAGNADYLQHQGAGIHLPQAQLTAQRLADILQGLAREHLLVLAQAAHALGRPDATAQVVSVIEQAARTRLTPHSPLTQASA